MLASALDHVLDSYHFEFFSSLGLEVDIPQAWHITKFVILMLLASALILGIYIPIANRARTGEPPRGVFWNLFESLLTFIRDKVAKPAIGEHDADRYVPFLWTLFLFVLFCNLLGMIPFLGSPTASITVTLVLAAVSFLVIHGSAVAKLGVGGYLKSFVPHIDVHWSMGLFLLPMITIIEVVGHFIKAFVLAVRLFANMFAGHTVLAMILSFITMAAAAAAYVFWPISILSALMVVALSLLELFVAFLQAYIFVFLTALFMGMTMHPSH
jgi:F-type H+-transporting ATPase subunit a